MTRATAAQGGVTREARVWEFWLDINGTAPVEVSARAAAPAPAALRAALTPRAPNSLFAGVRVGPRDRVAGRGRGARRPRLRVFSRRHRTAGRAARAHGTNLLL